MERLELVSLLEAVQHLERKASIALMYSGLRFAQFRLLDRIAGCDAATVTQMSEQLGVTRASASVMVNELIRGGILAMVENPSDRRSFFVHLTDLGRNKLNVARSDLSVLCQKLSHSYPEPVIRALNAFAGKPAEGR